MQNATVNFPVEVSSLTADSVVMLATSIKKTPEQFAAFLLHRGFSNLLRARRRTRTSFLARGFSNLAASVVVGTAERGGEAAGTEAGGREGAADAI